MPPPSGRVLAYNQLLYNDLDQTAGPRGVPERGGGEAATGLPLRNHYATCGPVSAPRCLTYKMLCDHVTIKTRRLLLGTYLGFILVLTLAPVPSTPLDQVRGFDKIVHFVLFGALAGLAYWCFDPPSRRAIWISLGLTVSMAGLVELAQAQLDYRSGDLRDFVAGTVGAVGAVSLTTLWHRFAGTRGPEPSGFRTGSSPVREPD